MAGLYVSVGTWIPSHVGIVGNDRLTQRLGRQPRCHAPVGCASPLQILIPVSKVCAAQVAAGLGQDNREQTERLETSYRKMEIVLPEREEARGNAQ